MQTIDSGINANEDQLKYFKDSENQRNQDVSRLKKGEKIDCNEDFATDLEDFFNAQIKDIHNAIIAHRIED